VTAGPVDRTFRALGEPTRRQIVDWLADGGAATPTELAARLPITRQAVSRHLAALERGGVVRATRRGREVRYALDTDALHEASGWLDRRAASWDEALERLRRHLASRND
jgi:DNA-binding transcriptional ArsR family regulator